MPAPLDPVVLTLEHPTQDPSSFRVAATNSSVLEATRRSAGRGDDGWHDKHLHARLA